MGEGMATIRAALDQQLATADAAHAALKQPDDLKPVYDAAYARDVTMPAKAMADIFQEVDETMKSILVLADFVAAHQGAVKVQGAMIQTSDPSLQPALAAMIDKVREKGDAITRLCPRGDEGACQARCALGELRIREPLFAAHHSDLVRKLFTRIAQETNGS